MSSAVGEIECIEALQELSLDDLAARHRKERKEMQAKIQELKKNAPKSDKKKRKEALEDIARMETTLEQRHSAELNAMHNQLNAKPHTADEDTTTNGTLEPNNTTETANTLKENDAEEQTPIQAAKQRVSKAQKRRDKKSAAAKQLAADVLNAEANAHNSAKAIEYSAIKSKLKTRQLQLHHVATDGDCLYNAVGYQLEQRGLGSYSVAALRDRTADYIEANKDALICYMTNSKTGDMLTDEEFTKYCHSLRHTHAWGGQVELKALSSIFKVPIEVLQAQGAPTIQGGEEFTGPHLVIAYHRHLYSLGEHYNATKPLGQAQEIDSD